MSTPLFCALGSENSQIKDVELKETIWSFLETLGAREDVLILPPDFTRYHSQAGKITQFISEYYNFIDSKDDSNTCEKAKSSSSPDIQILPALGTHAPMTEAQISTMFGPLLASKSPNPFFIHDWRNDVATIGYAPEEMVEKATYGMVKEPWPAQLNNMVWEKRIHDTKTQPHKSLVLSIGQVVPHEVMGMANFNKNLFVGVGGVEAINLSHFIGAVHGMEKMMGRASNPLRSILNYASEKFLQKTLDLWYILTVMGVNPTTGDLEMKGVFIGNDIECYTKACDLSLRVNFTIMDKAPKRIIVNLDKDEYHSTWLGNKAIYRTRMAIDDGGELIILAPGLSRFGEDEKVDRLIRQIGYVGTPAVTKELDESEELQQNLSAAAHLIHGSTEGRFTVTYCTTHLSRDEIESVGFKYADLEETKAKYETDGLKDGWVNRDDEEREFYFINNPALGLWAVENRIVQ